MNNQKIHKQFGLWSSPVTPVSLARGLSFSDVAWDLDGTLVWLENRSDRGVLVVQPPDGSAPRDLNSEHSVRARVGYGGGDFTAGHGFVYFIESGSGRIYRQEHTAGAARPVTPGFGQYASPTLSPDGQWLLFVHSYEGADSVGIIDAAGNHWPSRLVSGDDFYMQPAWHPDGKGLAWIAWNFPNMPWDGTCLRLGSFSPESRSGAPGTEPGPPVLENVATVAGDENTSIFQPEFSPDGRFLAYVSDATGWWQIYLYNLESGEHRQLTHASAEHGAPAWVQGQRTYTFSPDGKRIYFLRNQEAAISLWQVELDSGEEERLPVGEEYTGFEQITIAPDGSQLALIASGSRQPSRVITVRLDSKGIEDKVQIRRRATAEEIPSEAYSAPEHLSWRCPDGGTSHGLYYPPNNPQYEGIGTPPLIVQIHGGPTSQSRNVFSPRTQFFTSRGYAVLEVNYRGSTGYGREYCNQLRGNWGIYDVQDAVSGASDLVERGLADRSKLVIMGGSAGGFTVLKALEDYPGFFKAGICLYGVSNQFNLVEETHKFEASYSDILLGPLPEAASVYRERSPLYFVEKIQDPLAIFQGEIDQVVPRNQSDDIVESLRRRNVPHIYHVYPGEGHGFRKTETIEHLYKTIERFLRQYVIYT